MPKHNCCAWNCSNSIEKKKQKDKYPELAEVTFHPFPLDNPAKQYVSGMSEKERRQKWIAECRLQSLNVTRHTRICSKHFEGGLGPTKANPVPTLFDFPEHLKRKTPLSRTDPEKRRNSVTPKARKSKKIIPKELYGNSSKNARDASSPSAENDVFVHVVEEAANSHADDCQQIHREIGVQTDITAEDICSMEKAKEKLEKKAELKRDLFIEDVCKNDRSVKFYTGLPSLACLNMLFAFIRPFAEKMKYWDGKKKTKIESYQVSSLPFSFIKTTRFTRSLKNVKYALLRFVY